MQSFRVSFALDTEGWYDSGNNRHTEYEEGCHQTGFTDDGTLYLYFIHTGNIYAGRPYQVKWKRHCEPRLQRHCHRERTG